MKNLALVVTISLMACGGSDTPAPVSPSGSGHDAHAEGDKHDGEKHEGEKHGENGEKHSHDFPAEVSSFHDVLSPLWHAEPGETRTVDTCGAIEPLKEKAAAVIAAPAPEKAASEEPKWRSAAEALAASVVELETVCADKARHSEFDATFKVVHDKFHGLIEIAGKK